MAQTTHRAVAPRPDMVSVKSVGNGDISYETVTLKQSADIYESGELLVLEYTQSNLGDPDADPPVDASGYDTKGSKFIKLAGSDWKDFAGKKIAVNLYRTNASLGDQEVTVVTRLAEIKAKETDLSALPSEDQAALVAEAAKQFLIIG